MNIREPKFLFILFAAALVFVGGGFWLYADQNPAQRLTGLRPRTTFLSPVIGTPSVTPAFIITSTSSLVTVTSQIMGSGLIANSVNLLRLGATGTPPTILGVMHDDGKTGDAVAGDGVYTLQVPFNEPVTSQIQLKVSAAFTGQLKRVTSIPTVLNVWGMLTDRVSGLQVFYPPGVYNATGNITLIASPSGGPLPGVFLLSSSPRGVNDGSTGPDPTLDASGFNIRIFADTYSGVFDINQWIASQYPNRLVNVITSINLAGADEYQFQFADGGEDSAWPQAVVYAAYHDFLPFGEEIPSGVGGRGLSYGETDEPRQKFTGKERDAETGLDFFEARYFSSAQGRFTSADQLGPAQHPENPQSWNLYSYVLNNPLRFVDPTGEYVWRF